MVGPTFTNKDGLNIFTQSWRPDGKPRGVIVLVPGFNSHSGYYKWVAKQFVNNSLAVYTLDLQGRGKSDGERFYVKTFDNYVSDVALFIQMVKSKEPDQPVYLLGHSAGGVVACIYTIDHQNELAGLICESFAFQVPAPNYALAVFKGLEHIIPHVHVLHLKNEDFSRDPKVVEAMNNDPLIAHETQATRTLAEMVRANERLKNSFQLIDLPVLILHGTGDKAVKASGSKQFYDNVDSDDKTLKLYEGGYHDLLNDIIKEDVMADILGWIDKRIQAARKTSTVSEAQ